ncbi:hypothetical protein TWF481_010835 [Arthrobotrys musiformis]|uniref:NADH:ubiquinone oxidoreductase intermediate-associated protein 30 domain-containing protein n=1 Tax=Arthrobotrys musiformis TaxID=47236 RepID=A0AAV9W3T2_9PEZI
MSSASDSSSGPLSSSDINAIFRRNTVTDLFGGRREWLSESWTASDDRVRGGRSQSYIKISSDKSTATFHGNLDITALGGAGFASQRTTDTAGGPWDLSKADGVAIGLAEIDDRIYTLVLKDTILPKRPDGREQSTISYEFSFSVVNATDSGSVEVHSQRTSGAPLDLSDEPYVISLPDVGKTSEKGESSAPVVILVPWRAFHPYYRGKRKPEDGPLDPLDKSKIQRVSVMCRSMFGKQFGNFSVQINSIATFLVSDLTPLQPRALFIPSRSAHGTDGAQHSYVFHKSLGGTITDPKGVEAQERDLVENFKELQVEETAKPAPIPSDDRATE